MRSLRNKRAGFKFRRGGECRPSFFARTCGVACRTRVCARPLPIERSCMENPARDLARRLGEQAEAACRYYLPNGRREGRYWLVGDNLGNPGRSLYVRLNASPDGRRKAGKWTDAGTGEHGDLLDIIAATCGHHDMRQTLDEARHFLQLPLPPAVPERRRPGRSVTGAPEAARRLWAASGPMPGSLASLYLAKRGLGTAPATPSLRFHPRCYYRPSRHDLPGTPIAWPAMIAAITDNDGHVTGVHRTWLDPNIMGKAPVDCPRRAMGDLLGNAVRFGQAGSTMVAGEGLETVLSLLLIAPSMPMMAGLSAAHLAAIAFPEGLHRLYVARDDDAAGAAAFGTLQDRGACAGIEVLALEPMLDDFNSDLCSLGRERLCEWVHRQFLRDDADMFLER